MDWLIDWLIDDQNETNEARKPGGLLWHHSAATFTRCQLKKDKHNILLQMESGIVIFNNAIAITLAENIAVSATP